MSEPAWLGPAGVRDGAVTGFQPIERNAGVVLGIVYFLDNSGDTPVRVFDVPVGAGRAATQSGVLLLPLPFLGLVELLTLLLLPIVLVLKFVNVEAPDVSVEAADV